MGAMGTWDEAGAGLRGSGPGLVDRCASCDSVLASWVGVGQRTSWGQPARFGVIPMSTVSGWG